MGAEYELKFRTCAHSLSLIREAFPGAWQRLSMQTTYYDTPSGAFSARRYTLRRRLENGVSVCTLKTPGQDGVRGEWETVCEDIGSGIDMLCKLGAPEELRLLSQEGLLPICGAQFTRDALTLELSGCTAELALDQGSLFSAGRESPLWEVELELKHGSRDCLDAYGKTFAETYGLEAEPRSKFARAQALSQEV